MIQTVNDSARMIFTRLRTATFWSRLRFFSESINSLAVKFSMETALVIYPAGIAVFGFAITPSKQESTLIHGTPNQRHSIDNTRRWGESNCILFNIHSFKLNYHFRSYAMHFAYILYVRIMIAHTYGAPNWDGEECEWDSAAAAERYCCTPAENCYSISLSPFSASSRHKVHTEDNSFCISIHFALLPQKRYIVALAMRYYTRLDLIYVCSRYTSTSVDRHHEPRKYIKFNSLSHTHTRSCSTLVHSWADQHSNKRQPKSGEIQWWVLPSHRDASKVF